LIFGILLVLLSFFEDALLDKLWLLLLLPLHLGILDTKGDLPGEAPVTYFAGLVGTKSSASLMLLALRLPALLLACCGAGENF